MKKTILSLSLAVVLVACGGSSTPAAAPVKDTTAPKADTTAAPIKGGAKTEAQVKQFIMGSASTKPRPKRSRRSGIKKLKILQKNLTILKNL